MCNKSRCKLDHEWKGVIAALIVCVLISLAISATILLTWGGKLI